jgi:hypothetical protein
MLIDHQVTAVDAEEGEADGRGLVNQLKLWTSSAIQPNRDEANRAPWP